MFAGAASNASDTLKTPRYIPQKQRDVRDEHDLEKVCLDDRNPNDAEPGENRKQRHDDGKDKDRFRRW